MGKLPPSKQSATDVAARIEAMHLIVVEVDAYQSACEDLFRRLPWSSGGDAAQRRDLARLDCMLHQTRETITKLLGESKAVSQEVVSMAGHLP